MIYLFRNDLGSWFLIHGLVASMPKPTESESWRKEGSNRTPFFKQGSQVILIHTDMLRTSSAEDGLRYLPASVLSEIYQTITIIFRIYS